VWATTSPLAPNERRPNGLLKLDSAFDLNQGALACGPRLPSGCLRTLHAKFLTAPLFCA
jgi:hypothetical protein